MKRGAIVTAALQGDYGKPRPAIVIQSDYLSQAGSKSLIICPITSHIEEAQTIRLTLEPTEKNGLRVLSQIMVDKIFTIPVSKVGEIIGEVDAETIVRLNRTLSFVIGLGQ